MAGSMMAIISVGIILCFPLAADGQQITKHVGVISLFPYDPRTIERIDELPEQIAFRLKEHLVDRLGADYYSRLKFTCGLIVDFDELYRVDPGAKNSQWKIFAFKIEYSFSLPEVGIKKYEAEIWLDKDGSVIREIDLPDTRNNPEKFTILPVKQAVRISKQKGMTPQKIELAYRDADNSIVWRMIRQTSHGTRQLDISAHNGQVLNDVSYRGIEE